MLVFPTIKHLEQLSAFGSVAEVGTLSGSLVLLSCDEVWKMKRWTSSSVRS